MSVRLDRIVTRGGDTGETSLGDGQRVRKDDPLIEAMGTVDELNAILGIVRLHCSEHDQLALIQNTLFDIGAILCIPAREDGDTFLLEACAALEGAVEELRRDQAPLKSFILPGGSAGASWAHMARVVARRAERDLVALDQKRLAGVLRYMNRLSDYFFVLARHENRSGQDDILWRPRQSRH